MNPGQKGDGNPKEYSLEETIQRWVSTIPGGATPSATLFPPEASGEEVLERLNTVVVTRTDSVGAFRLLEPIGVGGMGEVRSARQESLKRIVALKQLRRQNAGDFVSRQRFLAEALVTGELEHPNIVPVYELAQTEAGEPFYAMKLIRGRAWIDVIDEKGIDENLEILNRVCDAVAFAHSRGVLHRDLKPQNVMLGEYGEVILVDWGLGVSIVPGGKAPQLNIDNALAGTASYMAPEMAAGDPERIGLQSDVYLLGAILFRFLTGCPPHPGDTVTASLIAAANNQLSQVDCSGELFEIALTACATSPRDRYRDVRAFQAALRDAVSHAESRRLGDRAQEMLQNAEGSACYETYQRAQFGFEEALALWNGNGDAQSGLDETRRMYAEAALGNEDLDLAASLVPDGEEEWRAFSERVLQLRQQRDARRRRIRTLSRLAAGLTAVILLVLAVGFVLVSREKNRVVIAEARASEQRNLALQALDTLVFSVNASLKGRPAMQGLRETILDEAIGGLNAISDAQARDPQVDRRLGIAHQSMARIFQAARRNAEAKEHQERAVEIFEDVLREERTAEAERDLAEGLQLLGEIVANYRMGDLEVAQEYFENALALTEQVLERPGQPQEVRVLKATLERDLGDITFDRNDLEASEAHYQRLIEEARELATTASPTLKSRELYSQALTRMADLLTRRNEQDEAYDAYESARAVAVDLVASNLDSTRYQRLVGLAEFNLADTARRAGKHQASLAHHESAREIQSGLVAADPSDGTHRRDLLVTLWGLGELARDQNRIGSALIHYEEALGVAESLLELNPDNLEARRDVFICCKEVGAVYQEQGLLDKARTAFERGLGLCRSTANLEPESNGAQTDIVIALYFLAHLESAAGRPERARNALTEGLEILERMAVVGQLGEDSPYYGWIDDLRASLEDLPGVGY